jgi:sulfur carrier protein ThiS
MVKMTFRGEEYEVVPGVTLRQAIEKLDLNPHMVLGVRKGKLITDDTILNEGDEIKLVAVISGG